MIRTRNTHTERDTHTETHTHSHTDWELLLRTEVSSPHVGIISRRYPCLPIAEPSGPFLKILSLSGCSGHLITEAETSRKEGDLTVSILIDSSYSRFSGKDTGYFICWGTK